MLAHIAGVRFLLLQGLAFRGHDESKNSLNKGNYLEILKLIAKKDSNAGKVMLENAPKNCQLTSPKIQKDLANACARETTKKIIKELDGGFFSILADESADVVDKEQLSLCLRYVDNKGMVKERLLGLVHVGDTTSLTLKVAIESLLMKHSLTLSRVRGQGYDGASNMRGAIGGLRTLILNESPCAYYIHCFAHQLQLTLVAIATKNDDCTWLFETLSSLLNMVGASCKRKELIREKQAQRVWEALECGEIKSGSGLNQESSLSRPCVTRWSSHFKTIVSVFSLYPTILEVLDIIGKASNSTERLKVESIAFALTRFDFVFDAQLMLTIFGITNQLNLALQKKEQDIVNAMSLVDVTKNQLQKLRDEGWESHLKKVTSFCTEYSIDVPKMDDKYVLPRRYRRGQVQETNDHHFRVGVFLSLIDQILYELEDRFDERSK